MLVSVDLGYGYTKAVDENNKVIFPSVIAPAQDTSLDFYGSYEHLLEFSRNGNKFLDEKYFIGQMAIKTNRAVQITFTRDKFSQDHAIILSLTAAYLLGAEGEVQLATGLPITYYKNKELRENVKNHLHKVTNYSISVNGEPIKTITFSDVLILPQGLGAMFALGNQPDGLVGIIDIGYFTTDFMLFDFGSSVKRIDGTEGSIENAVFTAVKLIANEVTRLVNAPINLTKAQEILEGGNEFFFRGESYNVKTIKDSVKEKVGQSIAHQIYANWTEYVDSIKKLYLVGGGSYEFFHEIKKVFPQAELVKDAQWANALGFYQIALDKLHGNTSGSNDK